jgi:glycosyltransferase involved in cell wall biosynthesis
VTDQPRILFVSKDFPHDGTYVHGVFKRLDMWVEALSRVGRLEFLFFVPSGGPTAPRDAERHELRLEERWETPISLELCLREHAPWTSRWDAYGATALDMFEQSMFRGVSGPRHVAAVERALERAPDLVFVHRLAAMCPVLRSEGEIPAPILFDLDDIEHLSRFRRLRTPPHRLGRKLEYLQLPALWLGERRAIQKARRTFVCSRRDRRYLERQGLDRIAVVSNAVEAPESMPELDGQQLLFLGTYAYPPNVNAARRLALEIWPRVRERVEGARLVLAGADSDRLGPDVRAEPGVEVPGFVEDLADLYRRTRVVCCPIRAGGGTRFKIVEAAAYGRPIVSTAIGAEGLDFRDGSEILIRDDLAEFADACVELLRDGTLARRIGTAARTLCLHRYDRRRVVRKMATFARSELGR